MDIKKIFLKNPRIFHIFQSITSDNFQILKKVATKEVNKEDRILDLGCGTGIFPKLVGKNYSNYIGVDINKDYVSTAKRENFKFDFAVMDALNLAFKDGIFDVVFAMGLFHHLSDIQCKRVFQQIKKLILNEGKVIIIDAVYPQNPLNFLGYIWRKLDRGKYVRNFVKWSKLFGEDFVINKKYIERVRFIEYCVFVLSKA